MNSIDHPVAGPDLGKHVEIPASAGMSELLNRSSKTVIPQDIWDDVGRAWVARDMTVSRAGRC